MLLKRNNVISNKLSWIYDVNAVKCICFNIDRDLAIDSIGLIDIDDIENHTIWFDIKTLCYMDMLTIDNGEMLNVDALLALAKREDEDQR